MPVYICLEVINGKNVMIHQCYIHRITKIFQHTKLHHDSWYSTNISSNDNFRWEQGLFIPYFFLTTHAHKVFFIVLSKLSLHTQMHPKYFYWNFEIWSSLWHRKFFISKRHVYYKLLVQWIAVWYLILKRVWIILISIMVAWVFMFIY